MVSDYSVTGDLMTDPTNIEENVETVCQAQKGKLEKRAQNSCQSESIDTVTGNVVPTGKS